MTDVHPASEVIVPDPDDGLDINDQKQAISFAYVHAVAAAAGYTWSRPVVDKKSVDIRVEAQNKRKYRSEPIIGLQLKCTSVASLSANYFTVWLPRKNYRDLRDASVQNLRFLVVVTVPPDPESWLSQTEEETTMKRCGYWTQLTDAPAPPTGEGRIKVRLPREQVFGVDALHEMLRRQAEWRPQL